MRIEYDREKRALTLLRRGLDFEDTPLVFASEAITQSDERFGYAEPRFVTFGWLRARLVVVV